jgi:bacillithiol system protein YtxJ
MNWNQITSLNQVEDIKKLSEDENILIFKHSTRCPTSSMALNRVERNWDTENDQKLKPFLLDLIQYREISNLIAKDFEVEHKSPQAILIQKGKATFNTSHLSISLPDILEQC